MPKKSERKNKILSSLFSIIAYYLLFYDKDQKVLPEIRFTFDTTDANADFATKARSTDKTRPTVDGKISVANVPDDMKLTDLKATMKVRGNQTAGFDKKGFQIKFDKKQTVLWRLCRRVR